MALQGFLNSCAFTPASGGTADFVVSAAITGYLTPAGSGAVDGVQYSYRAENNSKTEWEDGHAVYTASGTTFARVPINGSAGAGVKTTFTNPPNVYIVGLVQDLPGRALLRSGSISTPVASTQFAFPAGYPRYAFEAWDLDVTNGTRGNIGVLFSSDGGSTFYNGASDYINESFWSWGQAQSAAASLGLGTIDGGQEPGSDFFLLDFTPGDGSTHHPAYISRACDVVNVGGSRYDIGLTSGNLVAAYVVVNALKMYTDAGNLVAGQYRLYGIT